MVISPELLRILHEVPESTIKEVAELVGGDNNFTELLARGEEFRVANTTPVYLSNDDQTMFLVTCEEVMFKRVH